MILELLLDVFGMFWDFDGPCGPLYSESCRVHVACVLFNYLLWPTATALSRNEGGMSRCRRRPPRDAGRHVHCFGMLPHSWRLVTRILSEASLLAVQGFAVSTGSHPRWFGRPYACYHAY